jgi:NAD+ synthase
MDFRDTKLGVLICEEIWNDITAKHLKKLGAEIIISINASPFELGKHKERIHHCLSNACATSLPVIYINQIGGQDELVFDGNSFILSDKGDTILTLKAFEEDFITTSWQKTGKIWKSITGEVTVGHEKYQSIYSALVLGLRDYVRKNNFKGVIIGMSGGVDSAISAAIAVDSIGKNNVRLIMMPSKYTSADSLEDAAKCAKLLGVKLETISIEQIVAVFSSELQDIFAGTAPDITEENLQSRIRGNILMALSNKFGQMVLTTGNKSEMAVGYATLYGDMCGGFNILKDIYKTDIFELCRWRNKQNLVIPERIINKAPTAELKPNQTDQDTLPPYDVLDKILYKMIEMHQSSTEIANSGFALHIVKKVARMVKLSEYKRRQSVIGVKISSLAFGRDRRYPITNSYDL